MTAHLLFPYEWVECSDVVSCVKAAHVDLTSEAANSLPVEWMTGFIGAAELNDVNVLWCDEKGRVHRVGGPAVEFADGYIEWAVHGVKHRLDGPARITAGAKSWYVNGKLHRVGGPAVIQADGTLEWYVDGDKRKTVDGYGRVLFLKQ